MSPAGSGDVGSSPDVPGRGGLLAALLPVVAPEFGPQVWAELVEFCVDPSAWAVSGLQTSPQGRKLFKYWRSGAGGAKIGWGTPGDYDRCVAEVGKYTPDGAHGLCAELHIAATGMTTARHAELLGGKG